MFYKIFFETWKRVKVATEQLETKMEKVIGNDKENKFVKEESEESCVLKSFYFKIQVSCPFHLFFKIVGTNYRSRHHDLFKSC